MGACCRDRSEETEEGEKNEEEQEQEDKVLGGGQVQFNGLVENDKTKKIKKRKPTGKKVKKKAKVDLDTVNQNYENGQKNTDPNSENYENIKPSKVRFNSKEELECESTLTSRIKRKVTGKRKKSKDKAIDIAQINKNYEISQNETSPCAFKENESEEKVTDSMNVQDESNTNEDLERGDTKILNMDKEHKVEENTENNKEENILKHDPEKENFDNSKVSIRFDDNAENHPRNNEKQEAEEIDPIDVKRKSLIPKLNKKN